MFKRHCQYRWLLVLLFLHNTYIYPSNLPVTDVEESLNIAQNKLNNLRHLAVRLTSQLCHDTSKQAHCNRTGQFARKYIISPIELKEALNRFDDELNDLYSLMGTEATFVKVWKLNNPNISNFRNFHLYACKNRLAYIRIDLLKFQAENNQDKRASFFNSMIGKIDNSLYHSQWLIVIAQSIKRSNYHRTLIELALDTESKNIALKELKKKISYLQTKIDKNILSDTQRSMLKLEISVLSQQYSLFHD